MGKILKDKERLTYIYCLKHPETGEIRYIGKTVKLLKDRLHNHIYEATKRYKPNYRCNWINSLVKKGLKPFIEEIDKCTWEESANLEIYYIKYYKSIGCNLVNLTDGGEGILGLKFSKERINKLKNSLRKHSKKVYQYDLNGSFIKEWLNAKEASENTGLSYTNIIHCCIGLKKSHGSFIWSYTFNNTIKPYSINRSRIKKVKVINIETGNSLIYNSITEACKDLNVFTSNAAKCLKGKYKQSGGYKWEYV